jgi:hypothetical protein
VKLDEEVCFWCEEAERERKRFQFEPCPVQDQAITKERKRMTKKKRAIAWRCGFGEAERGKRVLVAREEFESCPVQDQATIRKWRVNPKTLYLLRRETKMKERPKNNNKTTTL